MMAKSLPMEIWLAVVWGLLILAVAVSYPKRPGQRSPAPAAAAPAAAAPSATAAADEEPKNGKRRLSKSPARAKPAKEVASTPATPAAAAEYEGSLVELASSLQTAKSTGKLGKPEALKLTKSVSAAPTPLERTTLLHIVDVYPMTAEAASSAPRRGSTTRSRAAPPPNG